MNSSPTSKSEHGTSDSLPTNLMQKPLLRGHFHQAAFFFALGAWIVLITRIHTQLQAVSIVIYGVGLLSLFGVSALYHRIQWQVKARAWMRRLDHAAIFLLIAGTFTPVCLLGMQGQTGERLLWIVWGVALLGIIQSLIWVHAPKWLSAILYVAMGWLAGPYIMEMNASLGPGRLSLIIIGGAIYTLGAVVYAIKKPNPYPRVFGYHEIFHLLTIIAAILHFIVVASLI